MVDDGSWYVHERWPHDGHPVESDNFVVYSDRASREARQATADTAEILWSKILDEFAVTREMLRFPPGQEKIDIYAYHGHYPQDWSGRSYYGGILIWSPDHPVRGLSPSRFEPTLMHELVHVLQWSLTGGRGGIDAWFIEGLPLALANDLAGDPIRNIGVLAEYGEANPISIESYSQIPDAQIGEHFYYPLFQLAFEFLLDENGQGRALGDTRDVMIDVAEGESFATAFERRMGLGLDDFERTFFDLMDGFLR